MGKFDNQIAWLQERRREALEDIEWLSSGEMKVSLNGKVTNPDRIARAKADIAKFDELIKAYGARDA